MQAFLLSKHISHFHSLLNRVNNRQKLQAKRNRIAIARHAQREGRSVDQRGRPSWKKPVAEQ
jgi:hypothetical protein